LGRVDERCTHEDSSTDVVAADNPSLDQSQPLNAADAPLQAMQQAKVSSKPDSPESSCG